MSKADLEIFIFQRSAESYGLTLRFRHPTAGQDKSVSGLFVLDAEELRQRQHDPAAYGEQLAAQLFGGQGVRSFLDQALAVAASQQTPLHLRLFINAEAEALHALRWETLRLPGSDAPLATGELVRFSRYLDSAGWRPVRTAARDALRALVAIASPDVSGTTLAEVQTEDELAAARTGLGNIPFEALAGRGQVTLANLLARLRDGCDILYLVAHGMVVDGEPQILLEREDGSRAWTSGRELAARFGELAQPPSLVVLVSCQSAGSGDAEPSTHDGGALAGLGPRLAAAGVPAVVAMQGNLTMATAAAFMPIFLRELHRDGVVDRAMSIARGAVRERADWWMPVLYTRLEDGRVFKLPGAAGDPLFDLPALPQRDLPDKPFHYLDWYPSEHAEIFFGRGREIRDLYDRVTSPDGDPIILLYGQSGVGKSSLLAAGLLPRLKASYEISYVRRDQSKGLLGTLAAEMKTAQGDNVASAWRTLETQTGKPLLVVLDQVEELFTRPNPEQPGELAEFLDALELLFGDADRRSRGRLILGFRKEWLAELDKRLAERALPRTGVFLERLGRAGIAEVVAGPASRPRLRARYGLEVADALPGVISDDLLADRESPVAPMLAILLADMWDAAKARSYDHPVFDEDLYHEFRTRGLSLNDFLGRQLGALRSEMPEVVDSGLALDLLAYHTTPLGTAEQRTLADLETTYWHLQEVLPALVQDCRDLYLLVDPSKNRPNQPPASRLTHDTLAPHVRKRFDESEAPGQRARRILENRTVDWEEEREGAPLDSADLGVVENGKAGMRARTEVEIRLVNASHLAQEKRQAEALRVQRELEDARERELQQAKQIAQHEASRSRQKTRIIRVLATMLGLVLAVSAVLLYRALIFSSSDWQPISKNFSPSSWAYSIAYAKLPGDEANHLYCTSTLTVGVGCSKNGRTWNFYQQGFGTGLSVPGGSGKLPDGIKAVTALAIDSANPDTLLAFSDDRFYRSDDAGVTWHATAQLDDKRSEVFVLEVHERLAIAVAHGIVERIEAENGNEAIYISTDGGQSWTKEADVEDPALGKVYDATIDETEGVVYAATSLGLMRGEQQAHGWHWQVVADLPEARLVTRTSDANSDLAVASYDPAAEISTLWSFSNNELHRITQIDGRAFRLGIDPSKEEPASQNDFRAYVLLTNGMVVIVDPSGEKRLVKGVAPVGGLIDDILIGEPYDLAVVPGPTGQDSWVLMAHRKGLLKYSQP